MLNDSLELACHALNRLRQQADFILRRALRRFRVQMSRADLLRCLNYAEQRPRDVSICQQ